MILGCRIIITITIIAVTGCSKSPKSATKDECPIPSTCGDRKYCDSAKKAVCVRSVEGVNRCGVIPTSCHVQLCQKSADCSTLGPGYFCDTPNSGCCTDPPKELSRCVALFNVGGR